tara:strand:+ start:277 stop:1191 length:915 start_codon:yes stop_codon:yes gene_type:complete
MYHYCLITDKNYINSTICLINKILSKNIHVLCLDDFTENFFNENFKDLTIFKLNDVEKRYNLSEIKKNRSKRSYVFTLKSFFLDYIREFIKENEYLIYLDSDLYFFSNNKAFEENLTESAVHISPHNFDYKNHNRQIYGEYNAGVIVFKKNNEGKKVLDWWKNKCFENCSLSVSKEIYSDQKYLNSFKRISNDINIFNNPGINLAPWNLNSYKHTLMEDQLLVDGRPLILFHFHSFKKIIFSFYALGIKDYFLHFNDVIEFIYSEYVYALNKVSKKYPNLDNSNNIINLKNFIKSILKNDIKKF